MLWGGGQMENNTNNVILIIWKEQLLWTCVYTDAVRCWTCRKRLSNTALWAPSILMDGVCVCVFSYLVLDTEPRALHILYHSAIYPACLIFGFFFFGGSGVWSQKVTLARQYPTTWATLQSWFIFLFYLLILFFLQFFPVSGLILLG
jgi:hypothetical protein